MKKSRLIIGGSLILIGSWWLLRSRATPSPTTSNFGRLEVGTTLKVVLEPRPVCGPADLDFIYTDFFDQERQIAGRSLVLTIEDLANPKAKPLAITTLDAGNLDRGATVNVAWKSKDTRHLGVFLCTHAGGAPSCQTKPTASIDKIAARLAGEDNSPPSRDGQIFFFQYAFYDDGALVFLNDLNTENTFMREVKLLLQRTTKPAQAVAIAERVRTYVANLASKSLVAAAGKSAALIVPLPYDDLKACGLDPDLRQMRTRLPPSAVPRPRRLTPPDAR